MRNEVYKVFKKRDEFRVKREKADGANKGWFTSAIKVIEEMCGPLAQPDDGILHLKKDHEKQPAAEKGRSDTIEALAMKLPGQVMKIEKVLRTSRSK